jgi:hypothetical protein
LIQLEEDRDLNLTSIEMIDGKREGRRGSTAASGSGTTSDMIRGVEKSEMIREVEKTERKEEGDQLLARGGSCRL